MTEKEKRRIEQEAFGLLALRPTLETLRYITKSPPQEHGGFHPYTVLCARSALYHIARLRRLCANAQAQAQPPGRNQQKETQ